VILLTLLLLPPLSLNTLAYFMRFLHTVAEHSDRNKMTKEKLAIIIAPNLMPVTEMI
jgi:Rho GTPase-activating protein 11